MEVQSMLCEGRVKSMSKAAGRELSDVAMQVVVVISTVHHSFGTQEKWAYEEWRYLRQRVDAQAGRLDVKGREELRKVTPC